MTPREIADKIVRIASAANSGGEHPELYKKLVETAAELRAALPEQPLSRKWREEADEADKLVEDHPNVAGSVFRGMEGWAEARRECADDLDAQHDEDRTLLRRCETALIDWTCIHAPEHCESGRVKEARERLDKDGTLYYIGSLVSEIRSRLKGIGEPSGENRREKAEAMLEAWVKHVGKDAEQALLVVADRIRKHLEGEE